MQEDLRITIERFKMKSERFLKKDSKIFIIDSNNTYYFCKIVSIGEEGIEIQNFKGPRKFEKERIYWEDIFKIEEYKSDGELDG